ncbi:hypothetical protein COCOBI_03-0160 [Coccomyxa sp. Obi]|nr:hypothetical protein COCOBI_03-0160 [Coccomyxa sp. Obi]
MTQKKSSIALPSVLLPSTVGIQIIERDKGLDAEFLTFGSLPLLPADVRGRLRRSIFVFTVSGVERGVVVFIGPKLAVTALHNIQRGDNLEAIFARGPTLREPQKLTIKRRHHGIDCLVLSTQGRHSYLKLWMGDPEMLAGGPQLAQCDYALGLQRWMPRRYLGSQNLAFKSAQGSLLSEDQTNLVYTGQTFPGDSGAPLVTRKGEVVAIHIEGMNFLRGGLVVNHPDLQRRVSQLEGNVEDAMQSVASACNAVVASRIPMD